MFNSSICIPICLAFIFKLIKLHVDVLSGEDDVYERLVGLLHVDILRGEDGVYGCIGGLLHVDVLGGEDGVYERLVETMEGTPICFRNTACTVLTAVHMYCILLCTWRRVLCDKSKESVILGMETAEGDVLQVVEILMVRIPSHYIPSDSLVHHLDPLLADLQDAGSLPLEVLLVRGGVLSSWVWGLCTFPKLHPCQTRHSLNNNLCSLWF